MIPMLLLMQSSAAVPPTPDVVPAVQCWPPWYQWTRPGELVTR